MSPLTRAYAIIVMVVLGAMAVVAVGGFIVVVDAKDQADRAKEQSEYNAGLMRIVIGVSGCKVTDSADQCHQRQLDRDAIVGHERVIDVECRIRRALAELPSPAAGELCRLPTS